MTEAHSERHVSEVFNGGSVVSTSSGRIRS